MTVVYLETTVPSYLAAYPSRDLVVAAHQQISWEWWETAKKRFDLVISEAVLAEIRAGDPNAIERRLEIVEGLPILGLNEDVRMLAGVYEQKLGLPNTAKADILHIAFAVAYEVEYLVTWNCTHIANGEVIRNLLQANKELNRFSPLILTPEELLETPTGEEP